MPTKLGLKPGSTLAVEDAIKGMVTRSANDAAVVVAEAIAGDEDAFAKLMTRKAQALGMSRTIYKNASGLPRLGPDHHGSRSVDARPRRAGTLPALLQIFLDPHLRLPRPVDRQPQQSAGPRRRRRRHQDRLRQRIGVQPGDVGSSRQSLPRRRGDGRQQRRQPRREDAGSDQRQDCPGLGQAHRTDGGGRLAAAGGKTRTQGRGQGRDRPRAEGGRQGRSKTGTEGGCQDRGEQDRGEARTQSRGAVRRRQRGQLARATEFRAGGADRSPPPPERNRWRPRRNRAPLPARPIRSGQYW